MSPSENPEWVNHFEPSEENTLKAQGVEEACETPDVELLSLDTIPKKNVSSYLRCRIAAHNNRGWFENKAYGEGTGLSEFLDDPEYWDYHKAAVNYQMTQMGLVPPDENETKSKIKSWWLNLRKKIVKWLIKQLEPNPPKDYIIESLKNRKDEDILPKEK